jgi:hypothetical protein
MSYSLAGRMELDLTFARKKCNNINNNNKTQKETKKIKNGELRWIFDQNYDILSR